MEELAQDPNSICRLCLSDLTEFQEYYEIDDDLSEVLYNLTTISVSISDYDNLSICMCPNCFQSITSFNEAKKSWLNNQQILQNSDIIEEEEEVVEESYKTEIDEEEYQVETTIDEHGNVIEYVEAENLPDDTIDVKPARQRRHMKRESKDQTKAKEVYKSLLQKCSMCDKMIEKNRMEGHINKHLDKRPFVCEHCGKAFYCKLLKRLHVTSIHTGITVSCPICERTFPSERSLYTHSLRHKNANRYKCNDCEKSFNNANSLKRHAAIHSGIREWKCDLCVSSFYRKFNLDVHVRTVHQKERGYSCQLCPKKFGYSRLLRAHMKKFHEGAELVEVEMGGEEVVTEC